MKKSRAILTNVSKPYKDFRKKMQVDTYLGLLI
jgi:hypothetical protein